MSLFPDALLSDLERLPGASHTFLKQLAAPEAEPLRRRLDAIARQVGVPVARRWSEVLRSLDNRRFFQGYAEAATAELLTASGWQVRDLSWPGPALVARGLDGRTVHAMVLAFIHQVRPGPDRATIARLVDALNRIGSRSRIAVLVRRWLPHDFDPEPVRHAVDLWLHDVDQRGWDGRYAAYEDEHVSLEFGLTGEKTNGRGVVAFAIGPFFGQKVLEAVERRMLQELDAYRLGPRSRIPVLAACVADQPWAIPPGYLRDLLYGKPDLQVLTADGDERVHEYAFGNDRAPCLFRDPLYRFVSGLLVIDRTEAGEWRFSACLNPWAERPIRADELACPALAVDRWDDDRAVVRWHEP